MVNFSWLRREFCHHGDGKPMTRRHIAQAQSSSPSDVQQENPIRFCNCWHSFDPSSGPRSSCMLSSAFSGMGAVGQEVILSCDGLSH